MKRILTTILAILLCAACFGAQAEGAEMTVVNCNEWVSLRQSPDTSSARLLEVPLGATVSNCNFQVGDFVCCSYQGQTGYILAEYLTGAQPVQATGELAAMMNARWCSVNAAAGGYTLIGERSYSGAEETNRVACFDSQGQMLWQRVLSGTATELDVTDAFLGGTAAQPLAMLYENYCLHALELSTGEELWTLNEDLGASITAAVAEDGTMYIGGYYGPDPVAISANGEVIWRSSSGFDACWLYKLDITGEGLLATYDSIDNYGNSGTILYGFDGSTLDVRVNG